MNEKCMLLDNGSKDARKSDCININGKINTKILDTSVQCAGMFEAIWMLRVTWSSNYTERGYIYFLCTHVAEFIASNNEIGWNRCQPFKSRILMDVLLKKICDYNNLFKNPKSIFQNCKDSIIHCIVFKISKDPMTYFQNSKIPKEFRTIIYSNNSRSSLISKLEILIKIWKNHRWRGGEITRRRKFVARQRVQWVSRLAYVISAGNLCGRGGGGGGGRLLTELGRSIPRRYMGQVHYHVSLHMRAVPLERSYLATLPSPRNLAFSIARSRPLPSAPFPSFLPRALTR